MRCKKRQNTPRNYRHNPKTCADPAWICLFSIFWCFLIVIIFFSISYGNYSAVIKGADSFGNICGQKHNKHFENFSLSATDTSKKPFLLFFDVKDMGGAVKICTEKCPFYSLETIFRMFQYFEIYSSQICIYEFNILKAAHLENYPPSLSRRGPCPSVAKKSIPYRNRCVVIDLKNIVKDFYTLLNSGGLDQFFVLSVYLTCYYVVILCGFALVVSLILLGLMFWLTKIVAWLIWILTILANAALCTVLWLHDNKPPIEESEEEDEIFIRNFGKDYPTNIFFDLLNEFQVNDILKMCYARLTAFITTILIVLTLVLFKHLNRLKLLFEEARSCIKRLPGLTVAPTIALFIMALFIILSGYSLLCLTTASFPIRTPTTESPDIDSLVDGKFTEDLRVFQQIEYVESKPIRRTFWIYIIGFLWTMEFIFAFEEFCIGSAVAFRYFAPSIGSPSLHAIGVLFKYHLGTIAKGSAVITLLKIPRLILTFICKSLKKIANQTWIQRIEFLEECFEIFNHNAYVPAAFETTDFRPAGVVAWKIFTKSALHVESINNVFDFVLFVSKLCVASLTSLVGFILLKDKKDIPLLYMAPVLFSSICAFCIAHVVFSVFEMTIDAFLLCVCEDHLMHGRLKRLPINCSLGQLFKDDGENGVQVIKIKPICRQPFRSLN